MKRIITLTGMSTSGKTTLAKTLSATNRFKEAVSVTTRSMRPGEAHGVDYYFVNNDTFDKYISENQLIEFVHSHHASYGVPAFEVEAITQAGKSPVMVLEPNGVKSISSYSKTHGHDMLSVYVKADMNVIIQRFFKRIESQQISGVDINWLSEAKRMHTILYSESKWEHLHPWDLTVQNLHENNCLKSLVNNLLYESSESLKSLYQASFNVQEYRSTGRVIPFEKLAYIIRKVAEGKASENEFLQQIMSMEKDSLILEP